jgi:hypothetical protein
MTVLHSALAFIEENLPSYYESKDKTNPLQEHTISNLIPKHLGNTPKFNSGHMSGEQKDSMYS